MAHDPDFERELPTWRGTAPVGQVTVPGLFMRGLVAEVDRLREAIRDHMNQRGDDRCHLDDGELYAALPEGDTRPARDAAVTLENCERYVRCRQQGREYVSPQRRIEELEKVLGRADEVLDDVIASLHSGSREFQDAMKVRREIAALLGSRTDYLI